MNTTATIVEQTKKWIARVVIGCNFCPFASRELKRNSIHYQVESSTETDECLYAFIQECIRLDDNENIDTSFLIFEHAFQQFDDYLDLVALAEKLLKKQGYEGIYQVASFHPQYLFAGSTEKDASNYTNRSIYPMLHLLREESIEKALEKYPDPAQIPERNIKFAEEKGIEYMKKLWLMCKLAN